MHTRRTFNKLLISGLAVGVRSAFAAPRSSAGDLRLGLESYSLSPLSHTGLQDRWIALMKQLGLNECNLFEPLIQPQELAAKLRTARETKDQAAIETANRNLSEWRSSLPISYFSDMRKKFSTAGIRFAIYTATVTNASTDADLERACASAQAIGAESISVSAGKSAIKRFIPLLSKYNLRIGIQGRPAAASSDPDAVARPADYEEAASYSPLCDIELDIGDATGAGFDVMPFVMKNHARIYRLELKDRKRDKTSMPWGLGDTPVKDILLYVRDNHLPIRCYIDCDYAPANEERIESITKCRDFIRNAIGT
jgi:sugar phosphate isomerase/epimerase